VVSIFKELVGNVQHTMCIHTDNERVFAISLVGDGCSYCKEGFTSWMDAYDHGKGVLESRVARLAPEFRQ